MRSQEFGWLTSPSCAHNFTQVFMYHMLTFSKKMSLKEHEGFITGPAKKPCFLLACENIT